jgi:hypothetical protein
MDPLSPKRRANPAPIIEERRSGVTKEGPEGGLPSFGEAEAAQFPSGPRESFERRRRCNAVAVGVLAIGAASITMARLSPSALAGPPIAGGSASQAMGAR